MRKLLRANFARLWKSKIFWLCGALMFAIGAYISADHVLQNRNYATEWALDSVLFTFVMIVAILASVFTSLFVGTEYSDGTIRNKIVVGLGRGQLYLANLIVCIAATFLLCVCYLVPTLCIGIPFLESPSVSAGALALFTLVILAVLSVVTALFVMISMLCQTKAYSAVACILVIFALLFAGIVIISALNEPETYSAYSYTENGVTTKEEEVKNPNYISGTKRQVFEFLNNFLPGGQMNQLSSMEAERPEILALYDLIIFAAVTGCGMLLFRKKDLK